MDESKPRDLAAAQADLATAVDELRAALKPAALSGRAKAVVTGKAKTVALDSSGKPKVKVLVAVSIVFALIVTGLAVRLLGKKGSK